MSELPPPRLGAGSLIGRPQVRPPVDADELEQAQDFDENGEPVWSKPRAPGKAIPAQCLRIVHSPLGPEHGGGCINHFGGFCPGTQRDGGCLADLVKRANELGIDWKFEVNRYPGDPPEGYWDYCGDSLPEGEENG